MRDLIKIVENAQALPEIVYHGTTKDSWLTGESDSQYGDELLYLTAHREQAESYAEERAIAEYYKKHPDRDDWEGFVDPTVIPVVVEFRLADLHARGFNFMPDWGWAHFNNPDATWEESIEAVGSFCIKGFAEADKALGRVVPIETPEILTESQSRIPATPENIARAKAFVMKKWKERAAERGDPEPHDLSYSCKFTSMFAQKIFGGQIRGNYDHQYVELNSEIIDLNSDAADVQRLGDRAYVHDPLFFGNPDHKESMNSCKPRVKRWVEEFTSSNTSNRL